MAYNRIDLDAPFRTEEKTGSGAITPGHLLERTSADKVKVHATAEGNIKGRYFALADTLQGNDINDDYSDADRVTLGIFHPGSRVFAILADGQDVSIGDLVESAGDGTLQKHVADTGSSAEEMTIYANAIIGIAREAKDISSSSALESYDSGGTGWDKRIEIEVI